MHFGLVVLRLNPRDFWTLTPRELAVASGMTRRPAALSRAGLTELMNQHPDRGDTHE